MYRTLTVGAFAFLWFNSLIFVSDIRAQQVKIGQKKPSVLTTSLDFKQDGPIAGLPYSPVLGYPMKCSGDGRVFMQIPLPPDYLHKGLYSVSPTDVQHYDINAIQQLRDVRILSYYPSNSGLVVLVRATEDPRPEKVSIVQPNGDRSETIQDTSDHHFYIVEFDRSGSYRRQFQLDDSLAPLNIAVFKSGNFLVFAIARTSGVPQLAILDANGTLLSYVDTPRAIKEWSSKLRGQSVLSQANLLEVPVSQFVSSDANIVLVPSDSMTVVEIGDGGATRLIRLSLPTNLTVDSFIPASDHWYVRVRSSAKEGDSKNGDDGHFIYEVDPHTGGVIRRIETKVESPEAIACVHEGQFIAFRFGTGKFTLMQGKEQ